MINNLPNFAEGYVRIRIYGRQTEKILNKFARESVMLWKIVLGENYIETNIGLADLGQLKKILRNTSGKIKIIGRYGFPFWINRYKGRKAFVVGMVIAICMLTVLSNMVWNISVVGTERIDNEKVIEVAKKAGLCKGKMQFMIDYNKVMSEMYKQMGDIAWVNINQRGTNVNISIVESVQKTVEPPKDIPCDIIADKNAVIYDIVTLTGVPKVKARDVVKEGDVLVSGEIEVEKDGEKLKRIVHSDAKIEGKDYLFVAEEQELEITKKQYTGRVSRELEIKSRFGKVGPLVIQKDKSMTDKKERQMTLNQFGKTNQFGLVINEYYEYELIKEKYSVENAKKKLQEKIYENISSKLGENSKVVDVKFDYNFKDNKILGNAIAIIIEKIGKNKSIENLEIK